jgi:hypothetical protein
LEETLLKKGFFQAIFPKLLKVFGNRDPLWRGFKGFPLNLMTLPLEAGIPCGRGGFSGGDYVIDVYEWSLITPLLPDWNYYPNCPPWDYFTVEQEGRINFLPFGEKRE